MLEALITSKTRIKLLLKFFLNSKNTGYLRSLEPEFGESTNSIRIELNRFEDAGLLHATFQNKKKIFRTNTNHPLFPELQNLLRKHVGLDEIVERVIKHLGKLEKVYLIGDLAKGNDSDTIDLWFVGEELDKTYLETLIKKTEKFVKRKLSYKVISREELIKRKSSNGKSEILLLWEA